MVQPYFCVSFLIGAHSEERKPFKAGFIDENRILFTAQRVFDRGGNKTRPPLFVCLLIGAHSEERKSST